MENLVMLLITGTECIANRQTDRDFSLCIQIGEFGPCIVIGTAEKVLNFDWSNERQTKRSSHEKSIKNLIIEMCDEQSLDPG